MAHLHGRRAQVHSLFAMKLATCLLSPLLFGRPACQLRVASPHMQLIAGDLPPLPEPAEPPPAVVTLGLEPGTCALGLTARPALLALATARTPGLDESPPSQSVELKDREGDDIKFELAQR